MAQCSFIKPDEMQCRAYATRSGLCFRHDANNRQASLIASRNGGENRRLQGTYGHDVRIETPTDVKHFLSTVICKVWCGEVPVQVGSSMGFLTRCWLDAYEADEIEKRLRQLEERLEKAGL